MPFSSLLGQPTAQTTLDRAIAADKVHHAYRFEGPDGVGKEYASRLLCQALLCTEHADGCGQCSACTRVLTISPEPPHVPAHPDVILVERGLYPSASIDGSSEATGISVGQIRRIVLPRLAFRPHEGKALCIVIRRAEQLTVAAANALLKTLEEPPANTYFVLLTSQPGKLLDTIVSRTLSVRFGPLPSAVMQELMQQQGLDPAILPRAEGSLERARQLCEEDTRQREEDFVGAADTALDGTHAAAALDFADARSEERVQMQADLSHLARVYAERAIAALQGSSGPSNASGPLGPSNPKSARLWARRHEEVLRAMAAIQRNGSPALVLEAMMTRLRRTS